MINPGRLLFIDLTSETAPMAGMAPNSPIALSGINTVFDIGQQGGMRWLPA
jgi:hypothetical protein